MTCLRLVNLATNFSKMVYFVSVTTTERGSVDLAKMRENAGLTVRALANALGISHTAVMKWEKAQRINKVEFLLPLSQILGVTIEELIGLPASRQNSVPGGKLGQIFREVSELPRRQQNKVIEMAEAFLSLHEKNNGA